MGTELITCQNCHEQVQNLSYCPYCGARLDPSASLDAKSRRRAQRRAFARRWVLPIALLLVVIAFGIMGLALKGFRDGADEQLQSKQQQADIHYNRGLVWLENSQYEMAEAEFAEALRLVPDYVQAREQMQIAQVKQTEAPSPTPTLAAEPTLTPTAIVLPTPTIRVIVVPAASILFKEAQDHYQKKEWEEAISKLSDIQQQDGAYNTEQVTEMLFDSHLQLALELDEQGLLEDAIAHYGEALQIRPRVQEIEDLRRWADLYLRALSFWEIDWERVVQNLTTIYIQNHDYKDVSARLYAACIARAEEMNDQQRWCNATRLYEQAMDINENDQELTAQEKETRKIEQVVELAGKTRRLCEMAGATPLATPSPVAGDWPPWSKIALGTLIASCYDYQTDQSSICFVSAEDDTLHTWLKQADQPAVTLDGVMLAYHSTDPARPGLYAIGAISSGLTISSSTAISGNTAISGTAALASSGLITLTTDAEAQYPTWSPDGKKVAYTTYDTEKKDWFIYIIDLEKRKPPQLLRQGEWPVWGPSGLLAMTSCLGEKQCGICLYDPRNGKLSKITASASDRPTSWSPDGQLIAYMSDVDEISFNLYALHVNGFVWQITQNLSADIAPTWSPDGMRIAYVTNHRNDWTVYLTPPKGDYMQKERVVVLGAESAEWTRFKLAWIAPVLKPAQH